MSKTIKSISDLRPDPENLNQGTPRGHGIIEHSIRQHGAGRPGLAAKDGTMIAGSQTLEEMAALGFEIIPIHTTGKQWPVHIRDDIEPGSEEAKLMALEDNRASEVGFSLDPEVFAKLAEDFDLSPLYFPEEMSAILEGMGQEETQAGNGGDEFQAEPADGPTRTALGELWEIKGAGLVHRLLVGDCTDPANVARLMQGEKIEGIFTSPPYDQQRTYEGNMALDWRALVSGAILLGAQHCEEDAQIFVNLGLVHREGRVVRYWDSFIGDLEDAAWPLFGWYVWDKLNGMPGDWNGRLAPAHEWVFHFARESLRPKKTVPTKNAGVIRKTRTFRNPNGSLKHFTQERTPIQNTKIADSVVRVSPASANREDHPAVFPIALPEQFMQAYDCDIWYEPFCGSGTSIIAAHRTGRRCVGCEISPKYADVCLARAEAEGLTCSLAEGLTCERVE